MAWGWLGDKPLSELRKTPFADAYVSPSPNGLNESLLKYPLFSYCKSMVSYELFELYLYHEGNMIVSLQLRHNGHDSSTVYSDADQRKHQSSASLAFVREFTGDWLIPHTNGQLCGNVSIWWRHQVQFNFIIIFNVGGKYLGNFYLSQFQSINGLAIKIPHCELVAWEHAIELKYHFGIR